MSIKPAAGHHDERRVLPDDPAQAFIAHLLEDFADEWLTKAMFGYRWLAEVDQLQMSRWLAHIDDMSGVEGAWEPGFAPVVAQLVGIAGQAYVPFLRANELAAEAGTETFRMEAMGRPYEQGVFKYQLKCLRELRSRYAALDGLAKATLAPLLGPDWLDLLAQG